MVVPLSEAKGIGKPITKLCIIAAQDQPYKPAPLPEDLRISPPPNSCAENKKHFVICLSMCLQYMISIFAPFRSRSCVRSSR